MDRSGKTKFKPGQSGNPRGRPRGVPDRRNLFHWVTEEDRQAVFAKCVELARAGDAACMRLVLERIAPVRKTQHEPVKLPDGFEKLAPLEQIEAIDAQVAAGEIAPDVGVLLAGMAKDKMAAIEHEEMEKRISELEDLVATLQGGAGNG
ncbi:DUF5681 domain-containing protein [Methylocaldum sp.]|uniref:DUF5681 domain-containing protein n=1 Tax=Methylocaldum sp. TaxID=1969727 RepID=UPI002D2612F0|nr:DUF5681 domain-containing protein [Methylocaldum sp.]HYE36130.1 DUF5681 domain-containing protein [Methylocaldum sp.]